MQVGGPPQLEPSCARVAPVLRVQGAMWVLPVAYKVVASLRDGALLDAYLRRKWPFPAAAAHRERGERSGGNKRQGKQLQMFIAQGLYRRVQS